ncbi:uncharacterized protein LOC111099210 [Crassostrea virginica]
MIIYVESKAFPHRTFVVVVNQNDKIARVRARMLHKLFEIGFPDHQFRLRYKGQFLRDAFTLRDYEIIDNSVIKMISVSKKANSMSDLESVAGSSTVNLDLNANEMTDVKAPLYKEIKAFELREKFLKDFNGLLYMHFLTTCLTLMTNYYYSFLWTFPVFISAVLFRPQYTRVGGYVGNNTHLRFIFCIGYFVAALGTLGAAIYMSAVSWMSIVNHGCKDWEFVSECSHKNVFTAIFFAMQSLLLLLSAIVVGVLFFSFRLEVGDYIEQFLVQEKDIEEVMKAARNGRLKDKRTAAYELAAMAASGDDNKFRIVAEGGLEVLLALAMSTDENTQEHAVEALEELITIPSIQDNFVEMGGVKALTALLHSENSRIMQEAASAIYGIVSESDEHKNSVVMDHGLDDLAHAAYQGTITCQRTIASIFLDLAFNRDIRVQITSRNIPAQALIHLCRSNDVETQRYALQTLELLAIESSDMICAQENLLEILLELPLNTMDEKLFLLAGKILLYYAENRHTCELLMEHSMLKESLSMFARTKDPMLQKVVAKIIFCMLEPKDLRVRARRLKLDRVLEYIMDNSADREVWDMADQGLQVMNSKDDRTPIPALPSLSTLEKLNKMGGKDSFGSRASLRSDQGSSGGSSDDVKKGLN